MRREHNLAAKAAKEERQSLITNTAYATVERYSQQYNHLNQLFLTPLIWIAYSHMNDFYIVEKYEKNI